MEKILKKLSDFNSELEYIDYLHTSGLILSGCHYCMSKVRECPVDYAMEKKSTKCHTIFCKPYFDVVEELDFPTACIKEWMPRSRYCSKCGCMKGYSDWDIKDGVIVCLDCNSVIGE